MALAVKTSHDTATILESSTIAEAGGFETGTAVRLAMPPRGFTFVLDVTAAATTGSDGLSMYVQTLIGTTWIDVVRFSTIIGDEGAKQYVERVLSSGAEAGFSQAGGLIAGTARNLVGDQWRARWLVQEDTNAVFTCGITACPM